MTIDSPFPMRSSTDVLVIGAGPVGFLLACGLHRRGVDYLLVERSPQRSYFCKDLGVTPRTLELFSALNLAEEAITPCLALPPRRSGATRPFSGSIWIKRG